MPLTVPDKGEPQNDTQAVLFREYLDTLVAGIDGLDCVLSGGAVTAQGSPDMTVAVAKAGVLSNGTLLAVAAANATIGTADATNPRLDLVVINSAGAIAVRAGTAAAAPKPPARSANDVVLAAVYVPANDTTISSAQIVDMRCLRTLPTILKKTSTAVTFTNTLAIQTYFTCTIPSGLLLAGRRLRFVCGGDHVWNGTGTRTVTVTVSYGGTTMFANVGAALTRSTTRFAWALDVDLTAVSNASQAATGKYIYTIGAGAPTFGQGELGDAGKISGNPFRGVASVDSDAGNRDFVLQLTMGSASTSNDISMKSAYLELL